MALDEMNSKLEELSEEQISEVSGGVTRGVQRSQGYRAKESGRGQGYRGKDSERGQGYRVNGGIRVNDGIRGQGYRVNGGIRGNKEEDR